MAFVTPDFLKKAVSATPKTSSGGASATVYSATAATFNQNFGVNYFDEIYKQQDKKYTDSREAAFDLQKNGNGLFDRRILDNAHLVDDRLTDYWQMSAEELDAKKDQGKGVWTVDMRKDTNGDGEVTEADELVTTSLIDAIVDSYDSELDLYIEDKLQEIIETYGPSCTYNLRAIFGSPDSEAVKELARLGIRADGIGDHDNWQNRTYTFSLIDMSGLPDDATDEEIMAYVYGDNAEILEDAAGKKGSIIFADCLTSDGTAQGAEMNLSSILDQMGYECVSKADFMGQEQQYYDLLENIQTGLDNNLYASSGDTIQTKYGETLSIMHAVCAVYDINGDAPGQWRCKNRTFEQSRDARINYGGRATRGNAIDYGTTNKMPSLSEIGLLTSELDEALAKANDKNLTLEEREAAEKEARDIKKKIEEKAMGLNEQEKAEIANQMAIEQQRYFDDAVSDAQKAVDEAVANGEDAQEAIEIIAKQYDLDANEIAKEIKM